MVRSAIRFAFEVAAGWLDATVPASTYHRFLERALATLQCRLASGSHRLHRDVVQDMVLAAGLLRGTKILSAVPDFPVSRSTGGQESASSLRAWLATAPAGKVVSKEGLVAGTGRWLTFISESGDHRMDSLLSDNSDRLLRHIEVRRHKSLSPVLAAGSSVSAEVERLSVSAFLSRYARSHCDLRALNTAMKMNDWSCRRYRSPKLTREFAKYTLAVAEQERSIWELSV